MAIRYRDITDKIKFFESAEYTKSPYLIRKNDLKNLKHGLKIRIADDFFTRLQYITLGGNCLIPGEEYHIENLIINKDTGEALIKVYEDNSYWSDQWFESPNFRR